MQKPKLQEIQAFAHICKSTKKQFPRSKVDSCMYIHAESSIYNNAMYHSLDLQYSPGLCDHFDQLLMLVCSFRCTEFFSLLVTQLKSECTRASTLHILWITAWNILDGRSSRIVRMASRCSSNTSFLVRPESIEESQQIRW